MESHEKAELAYLVNTRVTRAQIADYVAQVWRDVVLKDPELRKQLQIADSSQTPEELRAPPLEIKTTQGALDGGVTLLVTFGVAGAHVGSKILLDLWSGIIFPMLKKKFGTKALTPTVRGKGKGK